MWWPTLSIKTTPVLPVGLFGSAFLAGNSAVAITRAASAARGVERRVNMAFIISLKWRRRGTGIVRIVHRADLDQFFMAARIEIAHTPFHICVRHTSWHDHLHPGYMPITSGEASRPILRPAFSKELFPLCDFQHNASAQ